jgi:gliding motility-associated lipoprotein GldH
MELKKKLFVLIVPFVLVSCIKVGLFEKQVTLPMQQWYYNNVPQFTFHIDDTSSLYNVFVVVRHTDLYEYNNIWLRIGLKTPSDSFNYQNINVVLASDSKGWEGIGMDDIFEVRKSIAAAPFSFKKPGDYTFSVKQIMRENPLPHILNIGIRIEKVKL